MSCRALSLASASSVPVPIRQGDITTGNATAASVWVVGIIGAAVGYGYYDIGIILAANLGALLIRVRVSANSPEPAAVSQTQR